MSIHVSVNNQKNEIILANLVRRTFPTFSVNLLIPFLYVGRVNEMEMMILKRCKICDTWHTFCKIMFTENKYLIYKSIKNNILNDEEKGNQRI